jgi:hypothetical protein
VPVPFSVDGSGISSKPQAASEPENAATPNSKPLQCRLVTRMGTVRPGVALSASIRFGLPGWSLLICGSRERVPTACRGPSSPMSTRRRPRARSTSTRRKRYSTPRPRPYRPRNTATNRNSLDIHCLSTRCIRCSPGLPLRCTPGAVFRPTLGTLPWVSSEPITADAPRFPPTHQPDCSMNQPLSPRPIHGRNSTPL